MQVNICHRLIKNMIEHGQNFINHYRCIISENIPKGVYATRTYAIGDIVLKLEGDLVLHLWTFKTPILKSLGNYCFINYYSFINFI